MALKVRLKIFFCLIRIKYWDPGSVFSQSPGPGSAFNLCGSETLEDVDEDQEDVDEDQGDIDEDQEDIDEDKEDVDAKFKQIRSRSRLNGTVELKS